MPIRNLVLAALGLALLCAPVAGASVIPLAANLDGPQAAAGAGTGSPGQAILTGTLDTGTNFLAWNVQITVPLTGILILAAHYHGPATAFMSAPILVPDPSVPAGALTGTWSASATISAVQAAQVVSGQWYYNIHSLQFPLGEIRGQVVVVPEPGTALLLGSGAALLAALGWRRRRA